MTWKPLGDVEYIVIHCAATPPSHDITIDDVRRWHLERGWMDVGYHYFIRRDGTLEEGRPRTRPGAHVRGYNQCSIGICLAGGVAKNKKTPQDNFTGLQKATLLTLLAELREYYPTAKIQGHRDFPGVRKACPSFDVAKFLEESDVPTPDTSNDSTKSFADSWRNFWACRG